MKKQTTKKLFAFIIVMMFSSLTQFVVAQKCKKDQQCPGGYTCVNGSCQPIICNCAMRGYGCGGNERCIWYCSGIGRCGFAYAPTPLNDTSFTNTYSNHVYQSTPISFALPQSEKNSVKIFDITAGSFKMSVDSKMQLFIHQIEWDAIDEKGNVLNSAGN